LAEPASAPAAEGKQFNVNVCAEIQRQIDNVKREIADAKSRIEELVNERRSREQERDQLRSWLRSALIGLVSGGVPDDENLDDLLRELDRLPQDFQAEAQRAADLARSLIGVVREIQRLRDALSGPIATLTVFEEALKELEARREAANCSPRI